MTLRFDDNKRVEMTNLNEPTSTVAEELLRLRESFELNHNAMHARTKATKRYVQCQLFVVVLIVLVFGIVIGIYSKEIKDDINIIQNAVAGVPSIETKVETLLSTTVPQIDAQVETLLKTKVPQMMNNIDQLLLQAQQTLSVVQSINHHVQNASP